MQKATSACCVLCSPYLGKALLLLPLPCRLTLFTCPSFHCESTDAVLHNRIGQTELHCTETKTIELLDEKREGDQIAMNKNEQIFFHMTRSKSEYYHGCLQVVQVAKSSRFKIITLPRW